MRDRATFTTRAAPASYTALRVDDSGSEADFRTLQGAPYLEARATTLLGVFNVIIAKDVEWARFYQAQSTVAKIEVPMLLNGVRIHMGTIPLALAVLAIIIAIRKRNAHVAPSRARSRDGRRLALLCWLCCPCCSASSSPRFIWRMLPLRVCALQAFPLTSSRRS